MAVSQSPRAGQRLQMFSALRNSNYRWFWLNSAAQAMAQGMQFLVLGFLVLDITDSSFQLGLVIFAFGLPNLIFAMLGGNVKGTRQTPSAVRHVSPVLQQQFDDHLVVVVDGKRQQGLAQGMAAYRSGIAREN